MPADLQIAPDAVDGLARRARRIVDDLAGVADGAAAELRAFAAAAEQAARRAREADRDSAERFR